MTACRIGIGCLLSLALAGACAPATAGAVTRRMTFHASLPFKQS